MIGRRREQAAGRLRPVVGGGDGQILLALEVMEEGALGHAGGRAKIIDRRCRVALGCGSPTSAASRILSLAECFWDACMVPSLADLHTNQLVYLCDTRMGVFSSPRSIVSRERPAHRTKKHSRGNLMTLSLRHLLLAAATAAGLAASAAPLAAQAPVRVGIVTFVSGPAAGPFGVPARNAAELTAEMLNAGSLPAPYTQKGFGGNPIELVIIDEAGGPPKQVTEFRNLVDRDVDIVIGYVSSGDWRWRRWPRS